MFGKILLLLAIISINGFTSQTIEPTNFNIPFPSFYAFQNGGMNITIPDQEGIKQFSVFANVNREYRGTNQINDIVQTTKEKWNNFWVIHVKDRQFELDDGIYFMYFIRFQNVGFIIDDRRWDIDSLYDDKINAVEKKIVEDDPNCPQSITRYLGKSTCRGKLIFSDEFDGDKVARKRWQIEKYIAEKPDFEFVTYNEDNIFLRDDKLVIKPKYIVDEDYVRRGVLDFGQNCTKRMKSSECKLSARGTRTLPPVNSSRIISAPHFTFIYGKIEFVAKLPEGDWIYPELFLVPRTQSLSRADQTQRILMGFVAGNENLKYDGNEIGCRRLEFGYLKPSSDVEQNIVSLDYDRSIFKNDEGWNKDFHTFTIIWEPDKIEFKVDDRSFGVMNVKIRSNSTFLSLSDEYYLAFGIAVGGNTFFPDGSITSVNNYAKPWQNRHPKARIEFWKNMKEWEQTWHPCVTANIVPHKENKKEFYCPTALQIEYVKVWAL